MRRFATARWLLAFALTVSAGCAKNSLVMQGQLQKLQQQQLAMSRQSEQLQSRAGSLDRDNQELGAMLAQSRQRTKVLEDQLSAVRDQLGSATSQLAQTREEKVASDSKVQALNASMQRRDGVSISPNNSLLQTLPAINVPNVYVRRDGDVIRVELPGNQLFESGSAQLRPGAERLITNVAGQIIRTYPRQIVGVEGHTDTDPIRSRQWQSNHQLSVGRAMAVYNTLVSQVRIPPNQLFLAGHGPNHPVVSNATIAGKQRNRRVELVVYPETGGR